MPAKAPTVEIFEAKGVDDKGAGVHARSDAGIASIWERIFARASANEGQANRLSAKVMGHFWGALREGALSPREVTKNESRSSCSDATRLAQ